MPRRFSRLKASRLLLKSYLITIILRDRCILISRKFFLLGGPVKHASARSKSSCRDQHRPKPRYGSTGFGLPDHWTVSHLHIHQRKKPKRCIRLHPQSPILGCLLGHGHAAPLPSYSANTLSMEVNPKAMQNLRVVTSNSSEK